MLLPGSVLLIPPSSGRLKDAYLELMKGGGLFFPFKVLLLNYFFKEFIELDI